VSLDNLQLNWLRTFEAAGRHQNFTEAAIQLKMTQSAVSQQIRLLEHQLGQKLFIRASRRIRLSDFGRAYLFVVQEALQQLNQGTALLFSPISAGSLELSVNYSFACLWLTSELHKFNILYPQVRISMTGNNWPGDFETSTVGLGIRFGTGKWPGVKTHRLFTPELRPYCTPRVAASIKKPEDLLQHPLIEVMGTLTGWDNWFAAQGISDRPYNFLNRVDSAAFSVSMAASNFGICLTYAEFSTSNTFSKALVYPIPNAVETPDSYYLTYDDEHQLTPVEALFQEWLLERFPEG